MCVENACAAWTCTSPRRVPVADVTKPCQKGKLLSHALLTSAPSMHCHDYWGMCHGFLGPRPSPPVESASCIIVVDARAPMALHLGVVVDKAQTRLDCGRRIACSTSNQTMPNNRHTRGHALSVPIPWDHVAKSSSAYPSPAVSALFAPRRCGPLVSHSICGRRAVPWRLCACGWQL